MKSAAGERAESVDIVVCVHNALPCVVACLDAVARTTTQPYRLILVDDGSDPPTRDYLRAVAASGRLIRHEQARGYTAAANAGLRASRAPWVVLLNSDTEPAAGWLDRMWAHGARDPQVGVIGPLSNSAGWQSAPKLNGAGDWRSARLPDGFGVEDLGEICAGFAEPGVEIPFINGFCYMIRRDVLDRVGLLDEATFPIGYGEEHDYTIRAVQDGWKTLVAGDAYVFHRGSQSFGAAARDELIERHERALRSKHDPGAFIDPQTEACRLSLGMASLRARLAGEIARRRVRRARSPADFGIAFITEPTEAAGGVDAVRPEAEALARMGVRVALLGVGPQPPVSPSADGKPVVHAFASAALLEQHLRGGGYGAIVAPALSPASRLADVPGAITAYQVPALGSWILPHSHDPESETFRRYVQHHDLVLFARTQSIVEEVEIYTGRTPWLIPPSFDPDAYPYAAATRARRPAEGPLSVAAMLAPGETQSNLRILEALRLAGDALGGSLEVEVFGLDDADIDGRDLSLGGRVRSHGALSALAVAEVLNGADVFLDVADPYTMRGAALPALACGCALVVGHSSGAAAHVRHLQDALVVDGADPGAASLAIIRLAADAVLRRRLQRSGLATASRFHPEGAAAAMMEALLAAADVSRRT